MASFSDLPPGWEAKDAGGRVVYINHIEKVTTWERPVVADEIPTAGITNPVAVITNPVVRAAAGTSPMSTDRAVAGMGTRSPITPPRGDSVRPGWESEFHDGNVLYIDHVHKVTTRTKPINPADSAVDEQRRAPSRSAAHGVGGYGSSGGGGDESLPHGWSAKITPEGNVYYENHATKSTTWDRPMAVEQPYFLPRIAAGSLPPIDEEESKTSMVPPPERSRPQDDAKKAAKNNEENWQARLEPYNNISVIATLLAGFGLSIFPLPRSDVPDGNIFQLGLAGHVAYNLLMCCSFSTNVLVAVTLTLQLYFTQRLAMLQSSTMAADFMMTTQDIRHCAVRGFFFVSLPAFMLAFALLLLTVLEKAAAVCTAVVTMIGLGLSIGSTFFYVLKFRDAEEIEENAGEETEERSGEEIDEKTGTQPPSYDAIFEMQRAPPSDRQPQYSVTEGLRNAVVAIQRALPSGRRAPPRRRNMLSTTARRF